MPRTTQIGALIALLPLALLAGCAPASTPAPTPAALDAPPAASTETPLPPPPIVLTDGLGRELLFDEPPARLVVAGRAAQMILHTAFLFDEADARIVAMEQRTQRGASMLPLVDSAYADVIQLERDAAAEAIAAARPDVVLLKSYLAGSLGAPLEALGLPTLYLDLETPEQFFRDVRLLGDLFGNMARAEQILDEYQARLDRVAAACAGVPVDERPTVLVLQYTDRGGETAVNVPPDSWLQTVLVELACGQPAWLGAAGDGWTVVGLEQVAAWDADMVFIIDYSGDPAPAVEALRADPVWAALRAVRDGEMYAFPGDFVSWDQPDPRWILGLEWLASRILPDGAYPFEAPAALQAFFQDLYGVDAARFEAEVLPLLNGDIGP